MSPSRPRRSLQEAFRAEPQEQVTASRAASLQGLLPPRFGNRPGSGAEAGAAEAAGAARSVSSRPRTLQPDSSETSDRVRNVAVYLPPELLERLRRTARSRELTYADLLVEAASAHLSEVTPAAAATPAPQWSMEKMPSRVTRRQPRPAVQAQIRLDGHQVAWLDAQVERLGLPSRTALVVALLEAHLGQ